ncbi:MAG: DoxX family protein [Chthoniobacterales bacterium]
MNALSRYADPVYCIMRLIVGLLFACHGGQKILGFPPGGHGPPADAMGILGAWIELAGGFLIAFGLLTRIAALIASGEMAYAYFFMHASGKVAAMMHKPLTTPAQHFFPILNGGESALIYCWVFLFIFFYGPGRWSIDALFDRSRAATVSSSNSVVR